MGRVNLIYSDVPFGLADHRAVLSRYADELREAAAEALDKEAILIVTFSIFHAE